MKPEDFFKMLQSQPDERDGYRGSMGGPLRHLSKSEIKDLASSIEILQEIDNCASAHVFLIRNVVPMGVSHTESVVKGTLEINFYTKLNPAQVDNAMKSDNLFSAILKNVLRHIRQNDNYIEAQEEMDKENMNSNEEHNNEI